MVSQHKKLGLVRHPLVGKWAGGALAALSIRFYQDLAIYGDVASDYLDMLPGQTYDALEIAHVWLYGVSDYHKVASLWRRPMVGKTTNKQALAVR